MPDLAWHYGPTADDPDPAGMWHDGCGGQVLVVDGGHVCDCGAQDTRTLEEIRAEISDTWWEGGWTSAEAEAEFHALAAELVAAGIDTLVVPQLLNRARKAVAREYGD